MEVPLVGPDAGWGNVLLEESGLQLDQALLPQVVAVAVAMGSLHQLRLVCELCPVLAEGPYQSLRHWLH